MLPLAALFVGLSLSLSYSLWPAPVAHAGGFYLLERGVRPLGRGGAFVAGADDPGAIWFNPAGIAYSGEQLLLDASLSIFTVDYTRIDSGGTTLPTVTGSNLPIPIPTIAATFDLGLEEENLNFGVAVMPPNAALMDWPTGDGMGGPAPQRYSLLTLNGSALAPIYAAVSWRPIPELAIGGAFGLMVGQFQAEVTLSACDGVICSFPEDPEYDAVAQIQLPLVQPLANFGAILDLGFLRAGLSISTPFALEGTANIRVRPPTAAAFQGAETVNRRPGCDYENPDAPCRRDTVADVNIGFPWVVRAGVEVRPVEELRLELSVVWETWSMQDVARIQPRDVWIENALGFLDYEVGGMNIPRHMQDTVSIRAGAAYTIERLVTVRIGGYFENGAFQDPYLSPLTIDSDKVMLAAGVGVRLDEGFYLDAVGGFLWLDSHQVRDSRVPQANPIRPESAEPVYVGNGDYSMQAPFLGLGVRWVADPYRGFQGGDEEEAEGAGEGEGEGEGEGAEPPAGEGEGQPLDPSQPWYLQGRSGGAAGAGGASAGEPGAEAGSGAGSGASEGPEEAAQAEPEEEETPAERRRRLRRERQESRRSRRGR